MENKNMEMMTGMETTSPRAHMKRKILMAAVLVICMAIFATGTLAFFSAEETNYNVITTGILTMDLKEETTGGEPWPEGGVSGVVPGTEVDKIPYVINTGDVSFYTRMVVTMKATGADGQELPTDVVSLNIDTANWTEKDGYYYYNGVVEPGKQTEPLFTKASFDVKMDNSYMEAKFEINIHAEAVQSKNNGDSALTAAGWKAEQ